MEHSEEPTQEDLRVMVNDFANALEVIAQIFSDTFGAFVEVLREKDIIP